MDAERQSFGSEAECGRWFGAEPTDDFAMLFPVDMRFMVAPRMVVITDLRAWRGHAWRLQSLVPPALRSRAGRLQDPHERERRLLAYALHRAMVARVLGRDPRRVEIGRMASGMPMVAGLPNVATSLSHAGEFIAIAVARDSGPVGVDIESIEHASLLDGLSSTVLHSRESARDDTLMDTWVRKEAVLKAIGSGLSTDMNTFCSRHGASVMGLPAAAGLRAWSLRVWSGHACLGVSAPSPDGLLARLEPGIVDVVSLRQQVARM